MKSTMMPVQLSTNQILDRAGTYFGDQEVLGRLPDKSTYRRSYREIRRRARQLAQALRDKAGIARGDRVATLIWNHAEHLESLLRHPARGRGAAHAQPAAAARRDRLHRQRRRRPRADRRRRAAAALRERVAAAQAAVRARDRRRRTAAPPCRRALLELRRRFSPARRPASPARARRERRRRHVLHDRHHRAAQGRRVLAPLDRAALAGRCMPDCSASARATRCCRSCRCSTPTPGACPTPARWSARSWCCPGRILDPPSLLDLIADERVDDRRRRADDLDRHAAHALDSQPEAPCSSRLRDARRRLGGAASR